MSFDVVSRGSGGGVGEGATTTVTEPFFVNGDGAAHLFTSWLREKISLM